MGGTMTKWNRVFFEEGTLEAMARSGNKTMSSAEGYE
jgi:hypothetical protein